VWHETVSEKSGVAAVYDKAVGKVCTLCDVPRYDLTVVLPDTEFYAPQQADPALARLDARLARPDKYEVLSRVLAAMRAPSVAREAYDRRDWNKAVTWAERAVEALDDPTERAQSYLLLAESQRERGDLVQAEVALLCALEGGSAVAVGVRSIITGHLGNIRRLSGNEPGAREAYRQAIELSVQPAAYLAASRLGLLEQTAGNHLEAIPLFEYAYKHAPPDTRPQITAYLELSRKFSRGKGSR
jgi:tetratricopeptide (TPR) repeat protein